MCEYNEVGSVPKIFFGFSLFVSVSHHFCFGLLLFFFFFIPKETKSACFSTRQRHNNKHNGRTTTKENQSIHHQIKMQGARQSDVFFGERESGQDVRQSNVTAVQAVANIVRSSLGPVGLDKV